MKKWMLIMGCALVVLMVGTAVAAWEDEGEEDEYGGITEEIWCELTACTGDDEMTDDTNDEEGFSLLDDSEAWGCCEYVRVGDGTWRCHCTEPVPVSSYPTATAFYVGRNANQSDPYDLIAVKGTYLSGWSFSVCGGCQKDYMERLLVWGIDSASFGPDNIRFIDQVVTYGNGSFTTWWSSQDYWDSVTAAGLGGVDRMTGSPQADWLFGGAGNDSVSGAAGDDSIWGVDGNDTLYGNDGDDFLYGGSGNDSLFGQNGNNSLWGDANTDYCHCGGTGYGDPTTCETIVDCD
jgi:hypothetical protein